MPDLGSSFATATTVSSLRIISYDFLSFICTLYIYCTKLTQCCAYVFECFFLYNLQCKFYIVF